MHLGEADITLGPYALSVPRRDARSMTIGGAG